MRQNVGSKPPTVHRGGIGDRPPCLKGGWPSNSEVRGDIVGDGFPVPREGTEALPYRFYRGWIELVGDGFPVPRKSAVSYGKFCLFSQQMDGFLTKVIKNSQFFVILPCKMVKNCIEYILV